MEFVQPVVVVTCPAPPEIIAHYDTSDAEAYLESWQTYGCAPVDGGTVEARSAGGQLVSTCTIENGICIVTGTYGDLPITLTRTQIPESEMILEDWGNTIHDGNVGWRMALVYAPPVSAVTPNDLVGRVQLWTLACPGAETSIDFQGPGIALDPGPPCFLDNAPQTFAFDGANAFHTVVTSPGTVDLPMGRYEVTHEASGATVSIELEPTTEFAASCSDSPDCLYRWWLTLIIASETVEQSTSDPGEGDSGEAALGSLEIHIVACPTGFTGPDFYNTCHGNGDAARLFVISSPDSREILEPVIETWPGPAIVRLGGLAPGVYDINLMSKFVEAPAYVFCSPDQGETVLVDQFLEPFHTAVQVPVNGQDVVCDWNQLT